MVVFLHKGMFRLIWAQVSRFSANVVKFRGSGDEAKILNALVAAVSFCIQPLVIYPILYPLIESHSHVKC